MRYPELGVDCIPRLIEFYRSAMFDFKGELRLLLWCFVCVAPSECGPCLECCASFALRWKRTSA